MTLRTLCCVMALLAALEVQAAPAVRTPPADTGAREIATFEAWYGQRHPGAVAAKPQFDVQREQGARTLRIVATLDGPPQRGAWSLCSAARRLYTHDARSRSPEARWVEASPPQRLVWLDKAADCGGAVGRVQLKQAMPDREIVTLLEQQEQVLQNARLLFAGNSRCAAQRAHPFRLDAIDIGPDRLYRFNYRSDRGGGAQVSVRKRGRELTAWNVNC